MKKIRIAKNLVLVSALLSLAFAMPAIAGTKSDVKKLQAEVASLKEGQQQIHDDMAEIKKLLQQGARAPAPAAAATAFEPTDLEVGASPVIGSADAAVTMFAYSDYQCPFCSRHATQVLPRLVKEYVDSGQLRIVMREYPIEAIHPRAFAASQAAMCAGAQDKYWEMHDLIFANQRSLAAEDLSAHAVALELDAAAYENCLEDEAVSKQIESEINEAYEMGISGTPSFAAGRTNPENPEVVHVTEYIRGAQPFARFQGVVEGLLEEPAEVEEVEEAEESE